MLVIVAFCSVEGTFFIFDVESLNKCFCLIAYYALNPSSFFFLICIRDFFYYFEERLFTILTFFTSNFFSY